MTFKTFGVRQLLNRWRKTVPSRRTSKGEATLAEFQPRSRLLVIDWLIDWLIDISRNKSNSLFLFDTLTNMSYPKRCFLLMRHRLFRNRSRFILANILPTISRVRVSPRCVHCVRCVRCVMLETALKSALRWRSHGNHHPVTFLGCCGCAESAKHIANCCTTPVCWTLAWSVAVSWSFIITADGLNVLTWRG